MANPYEAPRADADEAATQHGLIERGRVLVIACSVPALGSSAFGLYVTPGAASVLRGAIFAALLFFLYRGKNWARLTLIVLLVLGVGASLFMLGRFGLEHWTFLFVAWTLVDTASAIVLATSSSIRLFLRHQRQRPAEIASDDGPC